MNTTITFRRRLLLYDIASACYVMSRTIGATSETGEGGAYPALIADVADEGNADLVRRALDEAFSEVAFAVGGLPLDAVAYDSDDPIASDDYILDVELPDTSFELTRNTLIRLAHRYMVEAGVRAWLMVTAPRMVRDLRSGAGADLLGRLRALRLYGPQQARIRPRPW
ncbi:MAG: hypothetical protein NC336_06540 [Clostridium sp.]|nr:hypothetical protein [Clostridium sp.]